MFQWSFWYLHVYFPVASTIEMTDAVRHTYTPQTIASFCLLNALEVYRRHIRTELFMETRIQTAVSPTQTGKRVILLASG
jgi:hypothetical protein